MTEATFKWPRCRLIVIRATSNQRVSESRQRRSDYWCDPEQPKLRYGPTADKQCRARAARGINRGICDWNTDQVKESRT